MTVFHNERKKRTKIRLRKHLVILFLVLEGRRDRVFQFLESCLVKGAQLFNEISVINAKQIAN